MPEVAARAHLRWIVPVLDEAWADAGASGTTSTPSRSPTARASPGRCSSASTSPRRSPGSTTSRSSAVNHLEGHVYAAWLRDPGEADRPGPRLPARRARRLGRSHVPRRDARPPDLPAARADRRRRGRRGVRQGRPPARARLSRAGRRSSGGGGGQRATTGVFPRAWLGDSYDFSFSGLKTAARRIIDEARADDGLGRRAGGAARPTTTVAELAWGFQDAVVDVLGDEDDPCRAARPARARSSSVAASPPTPPCAPRLAGEAEALGLPLIVPRPGLCTDNGAMIGAAGARRFAAGERAGLDLDARPSLPLAAR